MLSVFQEEWDALALEAYTLRETLVRTRQELSTALYQHDAAVRVIARLTKERDEAREALSKINIGATAAPTNGEAMQVDSAPLPESVIAKIDATQERLVLQKRPRWIYADLDVGYRRLDGSDQSQKIGPRQKRSSPILGKRLPSHYIPEEMRSLFSKRETSCSLVDQRGSLASVLCLKIA